MPLAAPGGRFIVTIGADELVRAFDRLTFVLSWELPLSPEDVHCAEIDPASGLLFVGGPQGTVRRFDLDAQSELTALQFDANAPVLHLAFAGENERLFVTCRGGERIACCDPATGNVEWQTELAASEDVLPQFDPVQGTVLFERRPGRIDVLDLDDGALLATTEHAHGPLEDLCGDPNGGHWAGVFPDGTLRVFAQIAGTELWTRSFPDTQPSLIGCSRYGTELLVQADVTDNASANVVLRLDAATGAELARDDAFPMCGHLQPTWTQDGRRVLLTSFAGQVAVLDPETGRITQRWSVDSGPDRDPIVEPGYLVACNDFGRPQALHPYPLGTTEEPPVALRDACRAVVTDSRSTSFDRAHCELVIAQLIDRGIEFAPGLTDDEVNAVESRFEIRFPPDLRLFLQCGLPSGERFPDWRNGSDAALRERLEHPLNDVLWDVENAEFWPDAWGARPATEDERRTLVTQALATEAPLIPIFAHRFLIADPLRAGNPVLSVWQTDVIVYGDDLGHYLAREFGIAKPKWNAPLKRPAGLWGQLAFNAVD